MSRKVVKMMPEPTKHTSHAVWAGNLFFSSAVVGMDYETATLAGMTAEDEARQAMKNLQMILKNERLVFGDIVRATIMVTNMKFLTEVTKVYSENFREGNYPAREAMEVHGLPKGAKMAISVIAYKS